MAKVIAGVGCSHVPAIGAAMDNGKTKLPYWLPVFAGYPKAREWIKEVNPDVCVVVFNDHASAFSLEFIPTFGLGVGAKFQPADQGYGRRKVPTVTGHPPLAWHLAQSLILNEFDITIINEMDVDHGMTVPMSVMWGEQDPNAETWPVPCIPVIVNVIQYPPPTGRRCFKLGQAIRKAIESYPDELRVVVIGTGGMSHQLGGERAGLTNPEFDVAFLDRLTSDPQGLADMPHIEYIRDAGAEAIEMVMWHVMRGALSDNITEYHRHYYVSASNTGAGLIIFEENE